MSGKAQPAPPGMRRIPLATESYQHPSIPLSSKRLLNLFAEQEPKDARSDVALVSAPGLKPFLTLGSGPILAMNGDLGGRLYAVSGNHMWRVRPAAEMPPEDLGYIGTAVALDGTEPLVTIAVGSTGMVVCVPPNAYTCGHSEPLNQIGGSFPGANSVAYLDGYYVFTAFANDAQFFVSKVLDPTSYDALDFAYSDGVPNSVRRVISHRGDLWMMGGSGLEVWYDAGLVDFPFRRRAGGVIPYTCASSHAIATGDGSVFWVGLDNIIYRSNGYKAQRISTHAIEDLVTSVGAITATGGVFYSQGGHAFYGVTFGARTFVYDCATQLWAERSSSADGNGRWRPTSSTGYSEIALLGDYQNGVLWTPDLSLATDNGVSVTRTVTLPPIWAETRRAFMARVEVEMEVGGALSPGSILLEWSNDGGVTFTGSRTMSTGLATELRKRVFATRLGSFRQRVLRLTTQGHTTIYAVDAEITEGLH